MEAKKIVLISSIEDEKCKRKALKVVAGVTGVDSVAVDIKERKITVIGVADPVHVTGKLRKFGFGGTQLVSVGPAKEEKKEEKNPETPSTVHYVYTQQPYEYSDENPNACIIC